MGDGKEVKIIIQNQFRVILRGKVNLFKSV